MNAEAVDEAINAVRIAVAQGLSWAELERLIRCALLTKEPVTYHTYACM